MFRKETKLKCKRCKLPMTPIYQRSFGDLGKVYECPKCKGIVQK